MSPSALSHRRIRGLSCVRGPRPDWGRGCFRSLGRVRTPRSLSSTHRTPGVEQLRGPAVMAAMAARDRIGRLLRDDVGMSTVEYAIGCVAAAAFAAVLYAVVSGDSVVTALTQLVQRALTTRF